MGTIVVCSGIRQGRERKLLSLLDRNGSNSLDWRRCRWMPPNPAESAGRQWMRPDISAIRCYGHEDSIEIKNTFSFHVLFIGLLDAGGSKRFLRTVVTHHFMYGFVAFKDELC